METSAREKRKHECLTSIKQCWYSRSWSCPAAASGCFCTVPAPGGCSASPSLSSHNADAGPEAASVCLHTIHTHTIMLLWDCKVFLNVSIKAEILKCVPPSAMCVCGPEPGPAGSSVCWHLARVGFLENPVCPAGLPPFSPGTPDCW